MRRMAEIAVPYGQIRRNVICKNAATTSCMQTYTILSINCNTTLEEELCFSKLMSRTQNHLHIGRDFIRSLIHFSYQIRPRHKTAIQVLPKSLY